jgi:hypothetical protein
VSGTFEFQGATVKLVGLAPAPPGIFELELVFADRRVQILDRGDEIRVSNDPSASEKGCLKNYMLPIFERGLALVAAVRKDDGQLRTGCATQRGDPRRPGRHSEPFVSFELSGDTVFCFSDPAGARACLAAAFLLRQRRPCRPRPAVLQPESHRRR